jgi:hypothetical protein
VRLAVDGWLLAGAARVGDQRWKLAEQDADSAAGQVASASQRQRPRAERHPMYLRRRGPLATISAAYLAVSRRTAAVSGRPSGAVWQRQCPYRPSNRRRFVLCECHLLVVDHGRHGRHRFGLRRSPGRLQRRRRRPGEAERGSCSVCADGLNAGHCGLPAGRLSLCARAGQVPSSGPCVSARRPEQKLRHRRNLGRGYDASSVWQTSCGARVKCWLRQPEERGSSAWESVECRSCEGHQPWAFLARTALSLCAYFVAALPPQQLLAVTKEKGAAGPGG